MPSTTCLLTQNTAPGDSLHIALSPHSKAKKLEYFIDLSFQKNVTYFSAQTSYLRMATVVGVTAINVKTTAKKKKVRNKGKNLHCVGHFPGTAS